MPLFVAIGMAVAFAAFGAIALRAGWPDLKRAIQSRHWPRVEGLVEEVAESSHRTHGDGGSSEGREYRVRFCYVVDGRAFAGQWTSLISNRNRPGGCQFRAEQLVDVFYDPANPSAGRLFRGVKFQDIFLVVGGIVFCLGAFAPVVVYFALLRR